MNVLFAVDSVFQLMIAVNLRTTIYKEDVADIIVYNSTVGAKKYTKKLQETGAFKYCFFAETPLTYCGDNYSQKQKLSKYITYFKTLFMPEREMKQICPDFVGSYDVFLFNGVGALPECIYNVCKKRNPSIKCFRFEDSYLSYTQLYGSKKGTIRTLLETLAVFWGRKNLDNDVSGYYFSAPQLVQYNFDYPVLQAPKFNRMNSKLREILNHTFEFASLTDNYKEKYIFFECGDAFFFNNHNDLKYIEKLSSIVGEENILIKRHPRINENRFKKLGVHIAQGVSIPWELIQLNLELTGKIFITTKSSAALTSEVYFGDNCSVILL